MMRFRSSVGKDQGSKTEELVENNKWLRTEIEKVQKPSNFVSGFDNRDDNRSQCKKEMEKLRKNEQRSMKLLEDNAETWEKTKLESLKSAKESFEIQYQHSSIDIREQYQRSTIEILQDKAERAEPDKQKLEESLKKSEEELEIVQLDADNNYAMNLMMMDELSETNNIWSKSVEVRQKLNMTYASVESECNNAKEVLIFEKKKCEMQAKVLSEMESLLRKSTDKQLVMEIERERSVELIETLTKKVIRSGTVVKVTKENMLKKMAGSEEKFNLSETKRTKAEKELAVFRRKTKHELSRMIGQAEKKAEELKKIQEEFSLFEKKKAHEISTIMEIAEKEVDEAKEATIHAETEAWREVNLLNQKIEKKIFEEQKRAKASTELMEKKIFELQKRAKAKESEYMVSIGDFFIELDEAKMKEMKYKASTKKMAIAMEESTKIKDRLVEENIVAMVERERAEELVAIQLQKMIENNELIKKKEAALKAFSYAPHSTEDTEYFREEALQLAAALSIVQTERDEAKKDLKIVKASLTEMIAHSNFIRALRVAEDFSIMDSKEY